MSDKFNVNKGKENLIYLGGFIFTGIINIAFWSQFSNILNDSVKEDVPFIWLGAFSVSASFIALVVHYLMFRDKTK